MKKFLCIMMAAMVALTLISCGQTKTNTPSKTDDDAPVIGFCDMATDEPGVYYQGLFEQYITDAGCTPVVLATDSGVEKQISQIEDMITMDVDALFIRPVSEDALEYVLDECAEAGIPVIVEDISPEMNVTVAVSGQNHYAYGCAQAEQMMAMLDANPDLHLNVGYVWGSKSLVPAQLRRDGFVDTIAPYVESGRVTILDEQSIEGDFTKATSIIEDWRTSYPEMNCFVCANDDLALAAVNVIKAEGANVSDFYFYGMDAGDNALQSIKAGELTCSVLRDMDSAMEAIAEICVQVANGETVDHEITLDANTNYVDINNVDDYL